jgi:hypothetical protein
MQFVRPARGRDDRRDSDVARALVSLKTAQATKAITTSARTVAQVAQETSRPAAAYWLPLGRGAGGVDPPRPSSIPILMVGVLIWSGGTGRGAIEMDSTEGL